MAMINGRQHVKPKAESRGAFAPAPDDGGGVDGLSAFMDPEERALLGAAAGEVDAGALEEDGQGREEGEGRKAEVPDSEDDADGGSESGAGGESEDGSEDGSDGGREEGSDEGSESGEAEDDSDEEADGEQDELRKGWPESAQRRVDMLTAQKKEALERAELLDAENVRLKADLERVEMPAPAVSASDPLADVHSDDVLAQRERNARGVRSWCLKNMDGGTVQLANGEDREFTADEVRKMLQDSDALLMDHLPRRRRYLADVGESDSVARTVYPDLFKKGSPMFTEAVEALKLMPELTRFPDWKLTLGDVIRGRDARLAAVRPAGDGTKAAAGVRPVVKPLTKAPKLAPKSPESKPVVKPAARVGGDVVGRAVESGDDADLEAALAAVGL